jgi:hypothetical protein
MLRARQNELGGFLPDSKNEMIAYEYMKNNDFVAVAAVYKNDFCWHHYFLREDSELFEGIVERILGVEELTYSDPIEGESPVPVYQPR